MAWTTTDLDNIERAIATGELRVQLDGKEVLYRSIAELLKARDVIKAELGATGVTTAAPSRSFAQFSAD